MEAQGTLEVNYLNTHDNPADVLTKALSLTVTGRVSEETPSLKRESARIWPGKKIPVFFGFFGPPPTKWYLYHLKVVYTTL